MLPTWVGVVSAVSLAIIALAAVVVATASVVSALGVRTFVRALEQLAGPAISDVRQLIGSIKGEADALVGVSRDVRLRIVRAADAAEHRLSDLDALVEVVQEEMEDTVVDAAATLRNVRRGLSLWQWGRKVLKGKKKRP
jgi:anthranilate phosphoribosyltransferase